MKKHVLLLLILTAIFKFGSGQDSYVSINSQVALGSELIDNAVRTIIDSEGNRLVYGTFSEALDFDPSDSDLILEPLGAPDLFLASYDNSGNINWAFNLGRIGLNDGMVARDIALDANDNVLISGGFSLNVDFDPSSEGNLLTAIQGLDGFIAKYSSEGAFSWVKQFGSVGSDVVSAIATDNQDNHILGVRYNAEIDLDPSDENEVLSSPVGGLDASVVKLDAAGDYVWNYAVSPDENNEIVTSLHVSSTGSIALGAITNGVSSGIPEQSMLAGVIDETGTEVWTYDFQNQGQSNSITHLSFSADESAVYFGGRFQTDTDFDPSPDEFILSPLFADPFISKYSVDDGSFQWAKYVESSSTSDYCAGVHEENGVVYLAGSFDVLATFVPGDFTTQIPTNGASDVFVSVYDADSGEFIAADTFGGEGGEKANDAYFAEEAGLCIAGQFSSALELEEGESIPSQGFEDGFLAFFTYLYDLSAETDLTESNIVLYPVPANDRVYVELKNVQSDAIQIKLINIIGQTVFEKTYANTPSRIKLDIEQLNQGVYLVEIRANNASLTKRLIKQ